MGHRQIDLVIPGLIDGSQVLRQLLNKWNKNKAHESVTDITPFDDRFDLHDENNRRPRNKAHGNDQSDDALSEGELGLGLVLVLVSIIVLILFEYSSVNTMVSSSLIKYIYKVGDDQKNRDDARDLECLVIEVCAGKGIAIANTVLEDSGKGKNNTTMNQSVIESRG